MSAAVDKDLPIRALQVVRGITTLKHGSVIAIKRIVEADIRSTETEKRSKSELLYLSCLNEFLQVGLEMHEDLAEENG